MAAVRSIVPVLAGVLFFAAPLAAQGTGTISGRVTDSASAQPLASVTVSVEGTERRAITRVDGSYSITLVPAGSHQVRARRIGYATRVQAVSVSDGGSVTADLSLAAQAAALSEIVVTGYGTQRREAISGSVSTIDAAAANVGVIANANQMLQGRVPGVHMTTNNGEPGAGAQIRVRGGTSLSASNEPLYVVDGVPLQNETHCRTRVFRRRHRRRAAAQPAQLDQPERHRDDHGPEGRVGHGDLRQPRRQRCGADRDEARATWLAARWSTTPTCRPLRRPAGWNSRTAASTADSSSP